MYLSKKSPGVNFILKPSQLVRKKFRTFSSACPSILRGLTTNILFKKVIPRKRAGLVSLQLPL